MLLAAYMASLNEQRSFALISLQRKNAVRIQPYCIQCSYACIADAAMV